MPFKKTPKGTHKTPSGRTYTQKQMRAYMATGGFKRKPRKKKGSGS